jgi:hypothetical protein
LAVEPSAIDVGTFAVALLESAHQRVLRAIDGLTDDQLYWRPSPDTNSIGWLAWHLSRWKDRFAANAAHEEQVWTAQDWAARMSIEPGRTGQGDTLKQVAAFRPPRDLLLGYLEAAHAATIDRVSRLGPERLMEESQYMPDGPTRPVWRSLAGTVMDFAKHTGQIAYLRGLVSGYGWRSA